MARKAEVEWGGEENVLQNIMIRDGAFLVNNGVLKEHFGK